MSTLRDQILARIDETPHRPPTLWEEIAKRACVLWSYGLRFDAMRAEYELPQGRAAIAKKWGCGVELVAECIKLGGGEMRKKHVKLSALWGVAYPVIAKHCGYVTDDEIKVQHRNFCGDYWGWKDGPMGFKVPKRTTSIDYDGKKNPCSAEEMAGLYSAIQRTAANYGCDVPDPDPMWFQKARFDRD